LVIIAEINQSDEKIMIGIGLNKLLSKKRNIKRFTTNKSKIIEIGLKYLEYLPAYFFTICHLFFYF
tara:strand:+ start:110 stop:307 length:198 start_codon:yes stop_codon:yes gene_type:complete